VVTEETKDKDRAKPIVDAIVEKILYHLRYKMEAWPTTDDINEINRITKSIIVQHMARGVL